MLLRLAALTAAAPIFKLSLSFFMLFLLPARYSLYSP